MFTGIVEETGKLASLKKGSFSAVLKIEAKKVLEDIHVGDSIAVNGICLTVTEFDKSGFWADVMHETMNRSSLSGITVGTEVNLERAMPANGRFGGHIVSGHIDGTGEIVSIRKDDNAVWYTIKAESKLMKYIVEKGSVAVDGMSLTVAKAGRSEFAISAIPHTIRVTVLKNRKSGDRVNLEADITGKYIERFLSERFERNEIKSHESDKCGTGAITGKKEPKSSGITEEFLKRYGF